MLIEYGFKYYMQNMLKLPDMPTTKDANKII